MKTVYSVGQVNRYVKNMFIQDYVLRKVYVKGEVSNCKYHTSGHIYFSLKDETGVLSCVMFAGHRRGLAFRMKDGDRVVVGGAVDVYERDGRYQLYAKEISLEGAGALYERFLALKTELEEMGMFAEEYKQPIPTYAKTVGIVTAETGAAIQDIRNIAGRRNPYVQLILCPALVQGEGAAASIVHGIHALEQIGVDVIIVGRGGGSIEDLWAFNEEMVARAIFDCRIPVISAVGHQTDFTIADYVADLRAPTPSAAAELAVPDVRQMLQQVQDCSRRLENAMQQQFRQKAQELERLQDRLKLQSPAHRQELAQQELCHLQKRLEAGIRQIWQQCQEQLVQQTNRLDMLSPMKILGRGYALAYHGEELVRSAAQVQSGDVLRVQLAEGEITAKVQ